MHKSRSQIRCQHSTAQGQSRVTAQQGQQRRAAQHSAGAAAQRHSRGSTAGAAVQSRQHSEQSSAEWSRAEC